MEAGGATSRSEARAAARELVDDIAFKYGHVDEETWGRADPQTRKRIEKGFRELRKIAGSAISTLAKNVYSSNARFVFELLQNADDNKFDTALARNEEPYLSFRMYHDRLIIDCNEDGFTETNLKAICSVGQSSKTGEQGRRQGYVGEKGIGFKSVFKVAREVHINSGPFSFYFDNDPNESGLQMVCPIWEDHQEHLPHPLTRMTLRLHHVDNPESLVSLRNSIRQQFHCLQDSLLLFLKKLRRVDIILYDENDKIEESIRLSKETSNSNRVTLSRSTTQGGDEIHASKIYYVVTHTTGNLARNENRNYSEFEEQAKTYSQADVVLAFPLTAESIPIIEQQDVFAFLPMRSEGFSFVINSDFVTEASRQGLVTTSQRNLDLLRGICDAFIAAALQLCRHDKLRYTWMRFLPKTKEHQYDHFWGRLVDMLQTNLRLHPLMLPWSESTFRPIPELYTVPDKMLDKKGNPLFRDTRVESYLSKNYQRKDLSILDDYGWQVLPMPKIFNLIKLDIESTSSRMRSIRRSEAWHAKAANLISSIFESSTSRVLQLCINDLSLVPLQNGIWVSADVNHILNRTYFSKVLGEEIPQGLDLDLVDAKAERQPERAKLFEHLGVQVADVNSVRESVLDNHAFYPPVGLSFDIANVTQQLQFLYRTHHLGSITTRRKPNLVVYDHLEHVQRLNSVDVYMSDDHKFGAKTLVSYAMESERAGVLPEILFPHASLLQNVPEKPAVSTDEWESWLCNYAGMQRYLPLIQAPGTSDLSDILQYVANHLPRKFIGFLEHNWPRDGALIEKSNVLKSKLKSLAFDSCNGMGIVSLQKTYLPLPKLQNEAARFLGGKEHFWFLGLPEEVDAGSYASKWGFLAKHLGVGVENTVDFYIDMLRAIQKLQLPGALEADRVPELYNLLYLQYRQSDEEDREDFKSHIWDAFDSDSLLCVPKADNTEQCKWNRPRHCIWNAPSCFTSLDPLESRFNKLAESKPAVHESMKSLFSDILAIANCGWRNMTKELLKRQRNGRCDLSIARCLYGYLHENIGLNKKQKERMRDEFEKGALIYIPTDSGDDWVKPSQCIWASETTIQGKTVLDIHYDDLFELFVECLGVNTLNLQIVYDDLLKLASSPSVSVEDVKRQIWVFNGFLETSGFPAANIDAHRIRNSRIFPTRYPNGEVELSSYVDDCAIVDRMHLGQYFRGQMKTLDFSLNEVNGLGTFFSWVGLESKYMSKLVKEISVIDSTGALPVPLANCGIRSKAHAFCRIASHYKSPRLESASIEDLHAALEDAQVFQTDNISSEIHLNLAGNSYVHKLACSDLHIRQDEEEGRLQIYIPRKAQRREFCYRIKLPPRLCEWLMTDPETNQVSELRNGECHHLISSILNSSRSISPQILEEHGISSIDLVEPDFDDQDSDSGSTSAEVVKRLSTLPEDEVERPGTANSAGFISVFTPTTSTPDKSQTRYHSFSHERTAHMDPTIGVTNSSSDFSRYQRLLERVVDAARDVDLNNLCSMSILLEIEASFGFSYLPKDERNKMIGAAGELCVFERLKALGPALPHFSMENWQSTIRHYVSSHPDYRDIHQWYGAERADIMYNDIEGTFTQLLVDQGFLTHDWRGRNPKYSIEVKSTTSFCETPFFMTESQYRRMQELRNSRDEVYVIFRIYDLGTHGMGLRLYVDPGELEASGGLVFSADSWWVTPGR